MSMVIIFSPGGYKLKLQCLSLMRPINVWIIFASRNACSKFSKLRVCIYLFMSSVLWRLHKNLALVEFMPSEIWLLKVFPNKIELKTVWNTQIAKLWYIIFCPLDRRICDSHQGVHFIYQLLLFPFHLFSLTLFLLLYFIVGEEVADYDTLQ